MPCFNAERHLPSSIGSILAQTFEDWELIAVDDGSRDGTFGYLQAQADPRIRIISQANQGVSAARNAGLAHCRSEFVAFLDADDTWAPRFLETLLGALMPRPNVVLAYCGWQNLGVDGGRGTPFIPPDYEGPNKTQALLEGCRWPIHACLTRRNVIEAAGRFERRLRIGEDYLLWMEVAAQGAIHRVPEILAYYHHHDGEQATHDNVRAATDTLLAKQIFLDRHAALAAQLPARQRNALLWGPFIAQANALYWKDDLVRARPLFRKALLAGQGSLRDRLRMLPCLLPLAMHKALTKLRQQ